MLLAGLLAARKKVRTWRLGPARAWMQLHIWLGILAVPLILFHAGFRLGGALTTTLMVLFAVVTLSGLFGLALQQYLPTIMTERVPLETLVGQMDHVRQGLATDAYELVASVAGVDPGGGRGAGAARRGAGGRCRRVPAIGKRSSASRLPPSPLRKRHSSWRSTSARSAPTSCATRARARRRPTSGRWSCGRPRSGVPKLERLAAICEESYQLAVQRRLHDVLHGWLFVHAPLSFALFLLAAFHIVMALKY